MVNTRDLVKKISKETGYSSDTVSTILDSLTTNIGNTLIDGQEVRLTAFGTFKTQVWSSRRIWNVATGEYSNTKPTKRVVFSASSELKEAL